MTNYQLTHPPVPVLRRGRSLGLSELTALLGHLPSAALVLERGRATIAVANSALVKLTGFTLADLTGAIVTDLIPDLSLDQLQADAELSLCLARHKREPLDVVARLSLLDNEESWILVTLVTLDEYRDHQNQKREGDLRSLLELARLTEEPTIEQALSRVIDFTRTMFATDLVCIYQAEGTQPALSVVSSYETAPKIYPATIPSTDLIRLSGANLWLPGKRVQAEIHRHARTAGLTYLATAPLGQGKGLFGLLAVGGTAREPTAWMMGLLEIIAAHLSIAIQHFTLTQNLRCEVDRYQKLLTTHAAVITNSSESIILLSPDLHVLEINPAAGWMLSYDNLEVRGKAVEQILIGSERLASALEAARNGIVPNSLVNVPLRRRNGAPFTAGVQVFPVKNEEAVQAIIVFLNDTSLQEQIRQRTQQLEHRASLGDISAVFAHEVRNPINNISTGLQLIGSRLSPADANLDVVNRMEADCTRLSHLMDSILSFSRPMEPKFEPVDIVALLQIRLERWKSKMDKANVTHFFKAENNPPRINADPRSIEQVFNNLISNAIDAMADKGGTLAVRINPAEEITTPPQVEITISDTGPGIPDDIRAHMFEPFITNKPQGTGLGLAITKRILTAHHGSIKTESFPGGTIFRVYLPAYLGE